MNSNDKNPFNDPQTFEIIGAAMAVHSELGCGFLEPVYRAAFAIELAEREIPFEREVILPVSYRGRVLPVSYRADFVCYEGVIVELKAIRAIGPVEEAQVINYLKAANLQRALILNFGNNSLHFKRR